ncbi:MAG: histidine phosphatase family protein [Alphaproteobacteria bacterium]|nr:histidine phosphatase family protein [Alphaproteobacteria bacterium]MBU1527462.1 histidine phosphatase family protein [Alphaproteobacteria bacterium]MBU2118194.1 histidine phosphatase family protein [Alphaproteobacteria bacterium]MBU2352668.1 histidine phosphatase family protein [Alphaproteobacteria bacterium]MBU2383043.1 histidine phosphatase family protein [Alphaproteobacteria bacterium]
MTLPGKALLSAALWSLASVATAQHVVLVRHAEKVDASRDPVLSGAGTARAEALAGVFAGTGPDLILVSPFQRTALTAVPTIAASGAPVRVIALDGGVDAHLAGILAEIALQPDDAEILIVGHSNTVPLIARALGVAAADMPDCEYDRLTRIDLTTAAPSGTVDRYGAASDC